LVRCESHIPHARERKHETDAQQDRADHVGQTQVRHLRDDAAGDGSAEHGRAFDHLSLRQHRLERAALREVAAVGQRIDEPRLDGPREEREAEAERADDMAHAQKGADHSHIKR
jgi:hypothetical protein